MVVRISTGKNIRGLLHYNENKVGTGAAKLLLAHGFLSGEKGPSFQDKLGRFRFLTGKNPRTKTHAVHISLNFSPKDRLDGERLRFIALEYMRRIGFGGQPYLVYQHFDAGHPHLHLVTTNIRNDGKRIETHNLGRTLSEKARKELETEMGLVRAEKQQREIQVPAPLQKLEYGKAETKAAVSNVVTEVMRTYRYASFAEFNAILREFNVRAFQGEEGTAMRQHRGLVYSIVDGDGLRKGNPIKASAIYSRPTLANLEKRFVRNAMAKQPFREELKQKVQRALRDTLGGPKGREDFTERLKREGIAVRFVQNESGQIYGLSFVDHLNRTVFKASDLDRSLGAGKVLGRLEGNNVSPTPLNPGKGPSNKPLEAVLSLWLESVSQMVYPEEKYEPGPYRNKKKRKKRRKTNL